LALLGDKKWGRFWLNHFWFFLNVAVFLVKITGCFSQMVFILKKVEAIISRDTFLVM
jgi:hypothetical protein